MLFYAVGTASAILSFSFFLRAGIIPSDLEDNPSPLGRIFRADRVINDPSRMLSRISALTLA